MSALIELRGVAKSYAARNASVTAVESIDLDIAHDEFVALIGPSGCGKTTILNVVAGLAAPTAGRALIEGRPITGPAPDRGIVFQHYALLPWMTVAQNLRLAVTSALGERENAAVERRIAAILELVGLQHAAERFPRELSGGMKQRVALARALVIEPRMLLLDEPFGALDALTRLSLQEEMLALWEQRRIAALMITHDIDEALLLADRIVVMSPGPGATIARIIDVPFGRPRRPEAIERSSAFAHLRGELRSILLRTLAADERGAALAG